MTSRRNQGLSGKQEFRCRRASIADRVRGVFRTLGPFCALLSLCVVPTLQAQNADDPPATLIVWSEPDGADFDVWFSYVVDEKWTAPERVGSN